MKYSAFKRSENNGFKIGEIQQVPDISNIQYTDPFSVFLGPRAENRVLLSNLVEMALQHIYKYREANFPDDPKVISDQIRATAEFQQASAEIQSSFSELLEYLLEHATPYFSLRYQAHMLWDNTLPAIAGYFAGMLHNPNNVSLQASTSTTPLEMLVGWDLCEMVGFPTNSSIEPWSHLTADGTIANIESLWAIRELRSLPFALKMIHESNNDDRRLLDASLDMKISTCTKKKIILSQASSWELLNIPPDVLLTLPAQIAEICGISDVFDVWNIIIKYTQNALDVRPSGMTAPVILAPSSKHYSWPKAAAILGYGHRSIIDILVDEDGRMDMARLDAQLSICVQDSIPVAMVVAVCGSTEESAVDNISEILALRDRYREQGLDFVIHVDAAWGGYMLSTIRRDYQLKTIDERKTQSEDLFIDNLDTIPASDYVLKQLQHIRLCDTVTIDPHKWGYVQYPAGAVLYRNGEQRRLTTFTSAYIGESSSIKPDGPSVGVYGIEGSRPGAAAAAVYMTHRCLRPSISGYGKIINECLFNTKKYYARLLSLNDETLNFIVVPLPRLPAEKDGGDAEKQLEFIRQRICDKKRNEIEQDIEAMQLLRELGPDQNILDYGFNIRFAGGEINKDINLYNQLNENIYEQFSKHYGDTGEQVSTPFFVSKTQFKREEYGDDFNSCFANRLGLVGQANSLVCLRSVVMDPYITHTTDGSYFVEIINVIRSRVTEVVARLIEEI